MRLIPYYQYFFEFYRPTQKLHVLRFLTDHRVYDEQLFTSLVKQIDSASILPSDNVETFNVRKRQIKKF